MQSAHHPIEFASVIQWQIIDHVFPDLAAGIKHNPQILFAMQEQIDRLTDTADDKSLWQFTEEQLVALAARLYSDTPPGRCGDPFAHCARGAAAFACTQCCAESKLSGLGEVRIQQRLSG